MKRFIQNIFSIKNDNTHKVLTVLGIKLRLRRAITPQQLASEIYRETDAKLKRITKRPYLERVTFSLTSHCNLNCKSCDVGSPIAEPWFLTTESFEKDIKRLSELTDSSTPIIGLSGGEALLHPNLYQMFEIARKYFPDSKVYLHSNGILLQDIDTDFWETVKKYNIEIVCTKYPIKVDYDKIKSQTEKYNVCFRFFNDANVIKTTYHIPFDIEGKQDVRENFINCFHANQCVGLHNGKMYTCSPAAHASRFNKYFNTNMVISEKDSIDIHSAKSMDEILDFLSKPIPFCKYCNVKGRTFNHDWGVSKKDIKEWT